MKKLSLLLLSLYSWTVWACPNCHETVSKAAASKPPYTLIILATFIALTYVPFYLFFRVIKKHSTVAYDEN